MTKYETYRVYMPGKLNVSFGQVTMDFIPGDQGEPCTGFVEPLVSIEMSLPLPKGEKLIVGEAQAMSAEIKRQRSPLYQMGNCEPINFYRKLSQKPKSGFAGTILFYSLNIDLILHWMRQGKKIDLFEPKIGTPLSDIVLQPYCADQLPPLDVTITTNSGKQILIDGIELLNEGWGTSIDDVQPEKQHTFLARSIKLNTPIENKDLFYLLKKLLG